MVNLKLEKEQILKKHKEVYGGGNKIYIGSTDENPKPLKAQFLLDYPEVLRKAKNPFPFEGEILSAPDMPDIVKEIVNVTPKKESKKKESKSEEVTEDATGQDSDLEPERKVYSKEELQKLSFNELKKLAKNVGETGRSKSGLIKDILKHLQ